ncbi:MAG: DNA/RNA non-specific endonuclease [Bacteroidia bacterium]|nr:DNA/RNA non-specific endonuclease [Bacteroidia bacterium]
MAKFRRQHVLSRGGKTSFLGRTIVAALLFGFMIFGVVYLSKSSFLGFLENDRTPINYDNPTDRYFLPNASRGQVIHHRHYSLSYFEEAEQAEWVAYYLTRASLIKPNVPRSRRFKEDDAVKTRSSTYYDYRGSGFDRGHLVPAADMAFDHQAMQETFLMSNISPQKKAFNGGIWKELEENVRDWAFKYRGLYVCSGPVFDEKPDEIGQSEVWVPDAFFKAILDLESADQKGIGFIISNEVSYEPLMNYAVTIDELERQTGFDFFDDLLEDQEESKIESSFRKQAWPISEKRFDLRNTKWNRIQ